MSLLTSGWKSRSRWGATHPGTRLVLVVFCFSFLLAYALNRSHPAKSLALRPLELRGQWICAPGGDSYSGYFRKQFNVNGTIKHAWMVVAAKDGFEVSVNRNPIGRHYLWRPTRPFQNGGSESGQRLSHQNSALALNFPREYQWTGHESWMLPTYVEFTGKLQVGQNVICVEVESRGRPASANFYGEILLTSGKKIVICSDRTWKSEPVPPGRQYVDWTELTYRDWQWRNADIASVDIRKVWRSLPEEIYSTPFQGKWMQAVQDLEVPEPKFVTHLHLVGSIDEAWMRVLSNRRYELFINDQKVVVQHRRPPDIDNGNWCLGRDSALDPVSRPELLDPDEVGQFFVGRSFENPRDAQANLEEFRNLKPKTHLPFRNYRTTNRAEAGGEFDPTRTISESRRTPITPELPAERPIANALKRDRAVGGYLAYSIHTLLRQGNNKIEVRLISEEDLNWSPSIAVDGQVTLMDRRRISLPSAEKWNSVVGRDIRPVDIRSDVDGRKSITPRLIYRGCAQDPETDWQGIQAMLVPVLACSVFGIMVWGIIVRLFRMVAARLSYNPSSGNATTMSVAAFDTVFVVFLASAAVLFCGVLVEMSFQERHEILWFVQGSAWNWILGLTVFMGFITGTIDLLSKTKCANLRQCVRTSLQSIVHLPETRVWSHLIFGVVLLCVLLRAYKLDLQPLDDDEYASTQAILAILQSGLPSFVPEGVYYTRSPLFHYLTAAVAYPFGGNLWSLRLQSVAWSVATIMLTYLFGSRLLGCKWTGFGAALLLSVHPFEVFTGHVIRFYQMQQFFALLTIYLFCRGFVSEQKQSYRIATLIAFLCAVLSQEISAVMGAALAIGYVVFAKDLGWQKNLRIIGVALAVMMVVALDFVAFKTLCLTRTEGVSPVAEASIQLHFWYPQNLFAIFLGYSRLHIVPSTFFLLGLPFAWKAGNRNARALVMFLIVGMLATNLLVSHVSLRYQYWLFPIWILVSLYCARALIHWIVGLAYRERAVSARYQVLRVSIIVSFMAAVLLSWSLWRIPGSYDLRLLGDSTGCIRWVKSQMRPGDKLAVSEPHTHAMFLEAGSVDYDIAVPLLYDFAVKKDGKLVDRNGGGEVLSNVDQLIDVFEKSDRVWILLNREKFRTRGKNMRWEYPGARFEVFLKQNCELKHRTYLWHAYLWDASRGHFVNFRKKQ